MQGSSDIDVDLFIRSLKVEIVVWAEKLERPLNTCIVDDAVEVRVLGGNFRDEIGDGFDFAGIENVVSVCADLFGCLCERLLRPPSKDDLLPFGDELNGHGFTLGSVSFIIDSQDPLLRL